MFSKKFFVSSGIMSLPELRAIVLMDLRTELYNCLTLAVFFNNLTCGLGSLKIEDVFPT